LSLIFSSTKKQKLVKSAHVQRSIISLQSNIHHIYKINTLQKIFEFNCHQLMYDLTGIDQPYKQRGERKLFRSYSMNLRVSYF
jgi:hypothetical protein